MLQKYGKVTHIILQMISLESLNQNERRRCTTGLSCQSLRQKDRATKCECSTL